uniref:F-box domain-containing protein n=1 Tax=Caenorhabditis tropicalis TaxID=1561998 RepID=A0A1I7TWI9_9PELO
MEDQLPKMRAVFATIANPKENDKDSEMPQNKVFKNMLLMKQMVSYFNCVKGITALSYAHSTFSDVVLESIDKKAFFLRICYMFTNNFEIGKNETPWQRRIYMNNGVKIIGDDVLDMPTEVLLNVPNILVDSHYSRLTADWTEFNFIPFKTMPGYYWFPITSCRYVNKIQLISVNFEEEQLQRWFPRMNWPYLREVRLENVQTHTGHKELRILNMDLIQQLYVPPLLVMGLLSQPSLETIELVSLYINKKTVLQLEEGQKNRKILNQVKKLHLEDIIVEKEAIFNLDNVLITIIKQPCFKKLTLSLHKDIYGWTIIETILLMRIKIRSLELIINMKDSSLATFAMITRLQDLCTDINLTFCRTWKRKIADYFSSITAEMQREMRKWTKVTGVTLGKTIPPYCFTTTDIHNTDTYLRYISHLSIIPNLEKFGLADRVDRTVVVAATEFIRNSSLNELTLSVADNLDEVNYEMPVYHELLFAIPTTVRTLSLIYVPMDNTCVNILSKHADTLADLKYYQLRVMKRTRKDVSP